MAEQAVSIPAGIQIPPYSYLERKLAAHRQEVAELKLNEALTQVKAKKGQVKAELVQTTATASPQLNCSGEAVAVVWIVLPTC